MFLKKKCIGVIMFEILKQDIEKCDFCKEKFGFEPHPIFGENKVLK